MSESHAALANLELSRELYTEEQRTQFYTDLQAAINAEHTAYQALCDHSGTYPVGWKFWQKAPAEWKSKHDGLRNGYADACVAASGMQEAHPLLARVFSQKWQPLG